MNTFNQSLVSEVFKHSFDQARLESNGLSVSDENQLLQCTYEKAKYLGDYRTTQLILAMEEYFSDSDDIHVEDMRFDVKVHMLKKGMYPAIPGWHCDFVSRDENGFIQPKETDSEVRHFLWLSGEPRTQFINLSEIEVPDFSTPSWEKISRCVDLMEMDVHMWEVLPDRLVEFGGTTLHRARPARESGWRYLFRAIYFPEGDERGSKENWLNKKRRHSNVYLDKNGGW